MKRHREAMQTCAGFALAAMVFACTNSAGPTRGSTAVLRVSDLELLPAARTCPATTPVTIGGPGIPATYSLFYVVTISNDTDEPVTINSVNSTGAVVSATNGVGIGRPAHVFTGLLFSPNRTIAPGTTLEIGGPITVLCGDNPIITQSTFWDIRTQLNLVTSGGPVSSPQVTIRRNWSPCGLGNPCPESQPPLPNN